MLGKVREEFKELLLKVLSYWNLNEENKICFKSWGSLKYYHIGI